MGILNLTPDSFSDGGRFNEPKKALERIEELIDQGADIIDVGAESTGPGSKAVSEAEEIRRLESVMRLILEHQLTEKAVFSIDTSKATVAELALKHGFQIVNDVTALRGDPTMIDVLLKYKPYVCLMYAKDVPPKRTTRENREYDDVIETIKDFLKKQAGELLDRGFPQEKIIIDPRHGNVCQQHSRLQF